MMMKYKCVKWARDGNITNFQCSDGWTNRTLQRHGMALINIHGEASGMTDDEVEAIMEPERKELDELMQENEVGPECVYNDDKSGMFDAKIPNYIYVDKKIRMNTKELSI